VATEVEGLALTVDAGQAIAEFQKMSLAAEQTSQKIGATATGLRGFSQVVSGGMSFDRTIRDINDLAKGAGSLTSVLQSSDVLLLHMANIQLRGQSILGFLAANPWTLAIVGLTALTSLMTAFGAESDKAAQQASKIGTELHNAQASYVGLVIRGSFKEARTRSVQAGRRIDELQDTIDSGAGTDTTLADYASRLGTRNYGELLGDPGVASSLRAKYDQKLRDLRYANERTEGGLSEADLQRRAAGGVNVTTTDQESLLGSRRAQFDFQAQHAGVLELAKTVELLQKSNDERKKGQEILKIQGDTAMQLGKGERDYLGALIDYQERLQSLNKIGAAAGNTIAGGFEAAIFQANTLRDAIRNVALELSKIAFRATAGQFIENIVGGALRGLAGSAPNAADFQGPGAPPAGGAQGPPVAPGSARLTLAQQGDTLSRSFISRGR
jgi:hypothetical protein